MDSDAEDTSPLEQELEALSAIYINELSFDRTENGQVKEISLILHPATANDTTKQFVCMNLVFHPTEKYPDEVPAISIRNPRGLAQEEVSSLVEDMKAKAEESIGEVMLYTLIEMAKDSLTEGNIPHSPCIVCLEHFDENSSFRRTACYHYFHNRCLHKYLEHVRAQHAEEEAEDVTRIMHHREVKNKEIICPMCRCQLDEETLGVHCLDVDEDDDEIFVPSPALKAQQREMADRFERQKAQGGIIDLEWEKNKYLLNPEDRVYIRIPPKTSESKIEEEMGEAKQFANTPHSGGSDTKESGSRRDSQHPIQLHGNRSDDRKSDRSDRHRDFGGGRGRVWRGFRDRHRNLHNDRRYEGADEDGRPSDRYRYKQERSYNHEDYNDDHCRKKRDERDGKYQDGWGKSNTGNGHDRAWSRDGVPYDERRNFRGGGWRDKGRGGGKVRDGPSPASSQLESDDGEKTNADHKTRSTEEIDSSRLKGDSDRLFLEQSNKRKPNSSSHFYDDTRRDHRSYRSDGQDKKTKGHERRGERGIRGASYVNEEHFSQGDKWLLGEEEDRGSGYRSSRSDRWKPQRGRGSYQNRHHHSQDSHQESYGCHGERNQTRREKATTGAKFSDSRRNRARRTDTEVADVNCRSADEETDADKDLRNFEINQKWRRINSTSTNDCNANRTMPKKFGVIDDDEDEDQYDDARRGEDISAEFDDDLTSKPNPNYGVMNEEVDHFYPGFNQGDEIESWEEEVDPYATEYRRFRDEELKKYISHQKVRHSHFQNKVKQRVQQENAMDEELRRIGKERDKRHKTTNEYQTSEDRNTTQSTDSGASILEQFKQSQEGRISGLYQEDSVEKCAKNGTTEDKFSSVYMKTAPALSDASHSSARSHSSEELSSERNHDSSAQGGHSEKDVVNSSIVEVKEIKWCGRKPQENLYPPTSISDRDVEVDLTHNDVYEDAWKRKSALAKKPAESRKKRDRKKPSEQGGNRTWRERNHEKNSVQEERSLKVEGNSGKLSHEKTLSIAAPKEERVSFSENSVDGTSLTSVSNHVPKFQHEFKKPKPLDMRKGNHNPQMVSRGLNDVLVDEDKTKTASKNIDASVSKTGFKKPKPVDFRKPVHKPLHAYAKDAPS